MLDTKPLAPLSVRCHAARGRLAAAFGASIGHAAAAGHFDSCFSELQQLGLEGTGLIVAAEHMAIIRLRGLSTGSRIAPG